jgi:serine protein kinase
MLNTTDFKEIILKMREEKPSINWEGTLLDYLQMVKDNPQISQLATARMFNAIMKYGTSPIDKDYKVMGYDDLVSYNYFNDKIFGTLEPIHDLMKFLKAGAHRTETGKRILLLVGPPSSGKSTSVYWLKRCLENDTTPKYVIKGCPIHEEPLNLIPIEDRAYWEEVLDVKIEGKPCPVCQYNLDNLYTDISGHTKWEEVPVIQFKFSEHRRKGIGVFQPSDPTSQDESELIGRLNLSKVARYGDGDPNSYLFDGALEVANGGMLDFIELLKSNERLLYLLITVAQEKLIKSPSGTFPQIYIDSFLVGHTNLTEYEKFISRKENEALHDRIYVVKWPWNLKVSNEVQIYNKLIKESEFKNIHIAPHTLEIAAKFAVVTRLVPHARCSSLMEKVKIYNDESISEFKKEEIDIKDIKKDGRERGEGMFGISPRYIINSLNIALAQKEDKKCICPVDIINTLIYAFDNHIGYTPEEKDRFLSLLKGDKESIVKEYVDIAKREVQLSFLHAYDEQAQALFENYMRNAEAFCKGDKIYHEPTGEYSVPDEKLMRGIEELCNVPINSKKEFRNGIFVHKSAALERGEPFTFETFKVIKEGIEKKLMQSLKDIVKLTLIDPIKQLNEKTKRRRNDVIENLKQRGYCDSCAKVILTFVGEILAKTE